MRNSLNFRATGLLLGLALGLCTASASGADSLFPSQDYAAAYAQLRPLAEQGDANAQFQLGLICELGRPGVHGNMPQAAQWFARAATQGNGDAQLLLGLMYSLGKGVPRDLEQAYKWLSLATQSASRPDLRQLASSERERVAKSMHAH